MANTRFKVGFGTALYAYIIHVYKYISIETQRSCYLSRQIDDKRRGNQLINHVDFHRTTYARFISPASDYLFNLPKVSTDIDS